MQANSLTWVVKRFTSGHVEAVHESLGEAVELALTLNENVIPDHPNRVVIEPIEINYATIN
jgi:hypothetical protein